MLIQGRLLVDPEAPPMPGYLRIEADRIAQVSEGDPPSKPDAGDAETIITPAFVDAHLHFPQLDIVGCDGLTLLDWLRRVVYPAEARWREGAVAEREARLAVRRLVRSGTLGCAAFLSSHQGALAAAAKVLRELPLRAIVGRVLMDRDAPEELLFAPERRYFEAPVDAPARMRTASTPRFALSCTAEALAIAGESGRGGFVQTHLAETMAEVERAMALFPRAVNYAAIYDSFGLLHERTLLAHCLHLSDDEWRLIAKRRSVVIHCPQANTFLQSGLFDLDAAREHGVRLALGSDLGAGCDTAMPRVARAMIETAKLRKLTIAIKAHVPTPAEAWRLITSGNAEALGFDDAGKLEVGAVADLLLLRAPFTIDKHLLGRLIHTWEDDYIACRILAGKRLDML